MVAELRALSSWNLGCIRCKDRHHGLIGWNILILIRVSACGEETIKLDRRVRQVLGACNE